MSMWMWSNLEKTGLNVAAEEYVWRVTFEAWHLMQVQVHCLTSLLIPSQMNLEVNMGCNAWIPG